MTTIRSIVSFNNPESSNTQSQASADSTANSNADLPADLQHAEALATIITTSQLLRDSTSPVSVQFPEGYASREFTCRNLKELSTPFEEVCLSTDHTAQDIFESHNDLEELSTPFEEVCLSRDHTPQNIFESQNDLESDKLSNGSLSSSTRSTSTESSSSTDFETSLAALQAMDDLARDYNLTPEQQDTLRKLTPVTNAENLSAFFKITLAKKYPHNQLDRVLRTLAKVCEVYEKQPRDRFSHTDVQDYIKKGFNGGLTHTHQFVITGDKHVIITQDLLATGGFKIAMNAVNITSGLEFVRLHTSLAIHPTAVQMTKYERILSKKLAKSNPDLQQPYHIRAIERTTGFKDGRIGLIQPQTTKLVFFEIKMGSAKNLDGSNTKQIYSAAMCLLRGLNRLQEQGYVHLDIKPHNLLVKDFATGVIKIADLGLTKEIGKAYDHGTEKYMDPSVLAKMKENQIVLATPAHDAYSAGLTLLDFITNREIHKISNRIYKRDFNKLDYIIQQVLITKLKDSIESNITLSQEEKEMRLLFVDVANQLMHPDLKQRYTCAKAFEMLSEAAIKNGWPIPDPHA